MKWALLSITMAFMLCVPAANSAERSELDEQLSLLSELSVLDALPPKSVIGASLIRGHRWYVLSAREILALRKLLNGKLYVPPDDVIHFQLPPTFNKVVFWGISDGRVVWFDVHAFDDLVVILEPMAKGAFGWYPVPKGEEQQCLRQLIKRIKDGKEPPIAQPQTSKDVEGAEDMKSTEPSTD